jgi:hypothetical protein
MIKTGILSAALIAAALLATPATARESHLSSRHLVENANASTMHGAGYIGEESRFRGYESRDVWGHWGTYYGPMIPSIP